MRIGNDCLFGWNVAVRDSDGHTVLHDGKETPSLDEVLIGSHVWIGAHSDVLKGSVIPDGCIVAYRALVTNKFKTTRCTLAGLPARIVREKIDWKH